MRFNRFFFLFLSLFLSNKLYKSYFKRTFIKYVLSLLYFEKIYVLSNLLSINIATFI